MTDEEYADAVDEVLAKAVTRFADSRGNPRKLEEAIERYLEEGDALQMSPFEMRDYFDISTPGLPEQAGFSAEELDFASELFDKVTNSRYGS